jgi:hypothetical protein
LAHLRPHPLSRLRSLLPVCQDHAALLDAANAQLQHSVLGRLDYAVPWRVQMRPLPDRNARLLDLDASTALEIHLALQIPDAFRLGAPDPDGLDPACPLQQIPDRPHPGRACPDLDERLALHAPDQSDDPVLADLAPDVRSHRDLDRHDLVPGGDHSRNHHPPS